MGRAPDPEPPPVNADEFMPHPLKYPRAPALAHSGRQSAVKLSVPQTVFFIPLGLIGTRDIARFEKGVMRLPSGVHLAEGKILGNPTLSTGARPARTEKQSLSKKITPPHPPPSRPRVITVGSPDPRSPACSAKIPIGSVISSNARRLIVRS